MPRKPKHPCAYPGCPELVEHGTRFCPEHQARVNKDYERYGRDPAAKKRYGHNWRKVRERYIRKHPLCEICLAEGKAVPAEQVHHRQPLAAGGTNDEANLQSLCASCHSRVSAKSGERWGKRR